VSRQDGTARANHVNVLGVHARAWPGLADWWKLSPGLSKLAPLRWRPANIGQTTQSLAVKFPTLGTEALDRDGFAMRFSEPENGRFNQWLSGETAFINETLARQLGTREGDEIILRVRKPSALGLDAAISPRNEDTVAIRLKVGAILTPEMLEDFSLTAQPGPTANLFLPIGFLSEKVGVPGGANLLVSGPICAASSSSSQGSLRERAAVWLWGHVPRRRMFHAPWEYYDSSSLAAKAAQMVEPEHEQPIPDDQALPWLGAELARAWLPEDAGVSVRAVAPEPRETGGEQIPPFVEVASSRIFLELGVVAAALKPRAASITDGSNDVASVEFVTNGVRVLTYLANLIRSGEHATPYSMVTATDGPWVPRGMQDDEILVNQWLADDLHVKPGDTVSLSYYVVDSGSGLVERTNAFRVREIVPVRGLYADRTLMPEFPGLAKAESTHDWDAGFPLVQPIRDKDEAYWKAYRGTPKAFVTLAAGQGMWTNRFGVLTAIRYESPGASPHDVSGWLGGPAAGGDEVRTNKLASTYREAAYRNLLANLQPSDVGLRFEAVREQALNAAAQGQDFGQLFLGFSFFLVVAALLLMALLFQFGLEQRTSEVGLLLALGFTARQVRRLLLVEGAALALAGGVAGMVGGIGYARAMLWGLATVWRSAIGSADLQYHVTGASLLIGLCASTVVAALTIWLTLRKQARRPPPELLAGEIRSPKSEVRSRGAWIALVSGVAAGGLVGWALVSGRNSDPEVFFSAGALLLIAGLAAASAWLGQRVRRARVRATAEAQRRDHRAARLRLIPRRRHRRVPARRKSRRSPA
jgi:hypothetical protein